MNTEPTTVALPSDLLAAWQQLTRWSRRAAQEAGMSWSKAHSAGNWPSCDRSALDAEFRHMADDVDYQRDVHQILGERGL